MEHSHVIPLVQGVWGAEDFLQEFDFQVEISTIRPFLRILLPLPHRDRQPPHTVYETTKFGALFRTVPPGLPQMKRVLRRIKEEVFRNLK